eukprot:11119952-Karenia_brevis.AAC.1
MARLHPDWSIWVTGIGTFDLSGYPKSVDDLKVKWLRVADVGTYFDGVGFGDGSGQHTAYIETRRCGWG